MPFEGRSKTAFAAVLGLPAIDERRPARPVGREERKKTSTTDHRISDDASLLGLSGYDHDAVRIIMAAQIRLRMLRLRRQTPEIRDRARRISRARDMLLRTAVWMQPAASSAR